MGRGSQRALRDKAKSQVDELQIIFADLQSARKDGRAADAAALEDRVHRLLADWNAELADSSSSSFLGNSRVSSDLSSEIRRMLQLYEEEDDATSKLAELPSMNPKAEPVESIQVKDQSFHDDGGTAAFLEDYYVTQQLQESGFLGADQQYRSTSSVGVQHTLVSCLEGTTHVDYQQFNGHQESAHNVFLGFDTSGQNGQDFVAHISELIPAICPPPSAFLRPKCALWDCPRPAQGSEWYQDYCSSFHATLAFSEGPPGMTPVLRPGGIDLKDGPLFSALCAKTQGKNVGIPDCEGAATTKSPWNAPELFDLLVLKGESLREWLFFDKPRRAFESGNRKQRSLPDYSGRGWHESRKQVMKEFGGLKRSYYMDPQPLSQYEWHLYEYEINNCDVCALYRLEFKLVDPKKSAKGKVTCDSLFDLQRQMRRLNAENQMDGKRCVKGKSKANHKEVADQVYCGSDMVSQKENVDIACPSLDRVAPLHENLVYGPHPPFGYSAENLADYYGT